MKKLLLLTLGMWLAGCGAPVSSDAPTGRAAVLIGNLHDKNASIRAGAAAALGDMGPQVKGAIPELLTALKDEDQSVRKQAAGSLVLVQGVERQGAAG